MSINKKIITNLERLLILCKLQKLLKREFISAVDQNCSIFHRDSLKFTNQNTPLKSITRTAWIMKISVLINSHFLSFSQYQCCKILTLSIIFFLFHGYVYRDFSIYLIYWIFKLNLWLKTYDKHKKKNIKVYS